MQNRELELGDQLVYRERQLTQLTDLGKEVLHADVASRAFKVGDVAPDRHPPL
ncbi:Hydrogen peroxideinducible genes activator CDS [Bradyrhizobium sp.]|nr:Hydrogen peroxideinducible genes activator CDS [Bradyrhizobium sp.]